MVSDNKNIFPIGSHVKILPCGDGHLGFPIQAKILKKCKGTTNDLLFEYEEIMASLIKC